MIAVMGKEWRRLLRLSATPWALAAYVLLPLLVAAIYLRSMRNTQAMMPMMMPMMGGMILNTVATWQMLLLAVLVPWVSAGLMAYESEERTLDPLLASGQPLLGITSAKLIAVVLFLALVIVSGLPVFVLPILVGGINWSLMGRVVALEGATMVMMAGLGLALSAFSRRSGSAALAGVAVGLVLTLGTGMATGGASGVYGPMNPFAIDQFAMRGMGIFPGMVTGLQTEIPPWLYLNPVVGLNSALNSGTSMGLPSFPGSGSMPVFGEFRLWQVQLGGFPLVALLGLGIAWFSLWVRTAWRWPAWLRRVRRKRVKGVALNGTAD